MKKIYLSILLLTGSGLSFAQITFKKGLPSEVRSNELIGQPESGVNSRGGSRAVIWSDDFSNPANWVMSNSSSPSTDWQITNTMPANLSSQNFSKINSTSGGNFAIIDSDGPGASATQDANLTTATPIDLSAYPAVVLQFEQFLRRYMETYLVQVSIDGGTSWVDYPVNTTIKTNTNSPNPDLVKVNISATAANQPSVLIRFNYKGAYDWFWMIDDVMLAEPPANDLTLGPIFYSDYTKIPLTQVQPITFSGIITNEGGAPQTNVHLNAVIGTTFNSNSPGITLPMGQRDSAVVAGTFTPTAKGIYTAVLTAKQDQVDTFLLNNIDTVKIEVTDSIYSSDNNNYTGSGWWNGATNPFEIGMLYEIVKATVAKSISFVLTGSTDAGSLVKVKLYEDSPAGSTDDPSLVGESDNYTILTSDINATNTPTPKAVTLSLITPVTLEAGKVYIAMVENISDGVKDVVIASGSDFSSSSFILYDPADASWTQFAGASAMVRLNIQGNVSVKENPLKINSTLYPNPTSGNATFTYDLPASSNVSVKVYDVTGKEVLSVNEGMRSAGTHNLILKTEGLTSGVYYYSFTANTNTITKKLVIVK